MSLTLKNIDRLFKFGRIHGQAGPGGAGNAGAASGESGSDSGGGGGGNTGGSTGQAGYGGTGAASAEADSGYGTGTSGWGAASAAGAFGGSGSGSASADSSSISSMRSAFDDVTSRRNSLENTSLTEKGLLSDPGTSVDIDAVDPNSGAQSYGAPTNSTTTNRDGSVSIGLDLSALDPDGLKGWAANPQMAKNYSSLAREDRGLSNTLGNMVSAAQPNGWKGLAATGIGLLSGVPGVGIGVNAAIDANQAQGFRGAAFGIDTDFGQNMADIGASLGRTSAGTVGGMVGGITGALAQSPAVGMIGSVVGSKLGVNAYDAAQRGDFGPSSTESSGFDGYGSDAESSIASVSPGNASSAPNGVATGYGSNFGSYGSHVDGFNSYGPSSAQNAFS